MLGADRLHERPPTRPSPRSRRAAGSTAPRAAGGRPARCTCRRSLRRRWTITWSAPPSIAACPAARRSGSRSPPAWRSVGDGSRWTPSRIMRSPGRAYPGRRRRPTRRARRVGRPRPASEVASLACASAPVAGGTRSSPTPARACARSPGGLRQSLFTVLHPLDRGRAASSTSAPGWAGWASRRSPAGPGRLVLVERDRATAAALSRWIEARGLTSEARVVVADATKGGWPAGPYDLVFLDPPFDVWGGPGGGTAFLERGVAGLGEEGLLAVKVPGGLELPPDPRWAVATRKEQGDVAFWVLRRPSAAGSRPEPTSPAPDRAP